MARTPKARALGNALRQTREEHGLTLRALAAQINRDAGVLSRWETGDRKPKPEHVAQILTALGVNGERYDEIITLTYGPDQPQWVATTLPEQRQQLTALLNFEQNATTITEVSPLLVPGLLQTSGYVRAIMSGGGVPAAEIATRVAIRIGRKDVLTRPGPVNLIALIGEAALHQTVGSPNVMIEQLRHLLDMSQHSNINLRVIPYSSGWHPALEGSFKLIESKQATVVHLETRTSGLFLHEDLDVNAYQHAVGMVLQVATSPIEAVRIIAAAAKSWENTK
jgi:transcriptional regulator with XRE-family HTH domain